MLVLRLSGRWCRQLPGRTNAVCPRAAVSKIGGARLRPSPDIRGRRRCGAQRGNRGRQPAGSRHVHREVSARAQPRPTVSASGVRFARRWPGEGLSEVPVHGRGVCLTAGADSQVEARAVRDGCLRAFPHGREVVVEGLRDVRGFSRSGGQGIDRAEGCRAVEPSAAWQAGLLPDDPIHGGVWSVRIGGTECSATFSMAGRALCVRVAPSSGRGRRGCGRCG